MMKKLTTLVIASLLFQLSYAQGELIDSYNKGVGHLKGKKYQKAIVVFSDILKKVEDEKMKKLCYIYRGFAFNGLDDFKHAIADFDDAIKIDPTDLASYIDRGKTKAYAQDLTGAKADFEHVLSKNNINEQGQAAYFYLGKIAYQQGQYQQSINYYDKLISLTPEDPQLYFNRGSAKGLTMDLEGSIQDYDKAIDLKPDYMEAYANRGVQKINIIPIQEKSGKKDCIEDPCKDLIKAQKMGDKSVKDMIFLYCEKCK